MTATTPASLDAVRAPSTIPRRAGDFRDPAVWLIALAVALVPLAVATRSDFFRDVFRTLSSPFITHGRIKFRKIDITHFPAVLVDHRAARENFIELQFCSFYQHCFCGSIRFFQCKHNLCAFIAPQQFYRIIYIITGNINGLIFTLPDF